MKKIQHRTTPKTIKLDLKSETVRKLGEIVDTEDLAIVIGGQRAPSGQSCGSPVGC